MSNINNSAMSNLTSSSNLYKYQQNNITIFPSASAPTGDKGRLLSENMLAGLRTSITSKCYIIDGFQPMYNGRSIYFTSGSLVIEGRLVRTATNSVNITMPNTNLYEGVVLLTLSKDANGEVVSGVDGTCNGVTIFCVSKTTLTNNRLTYADLLSADNIMVLGFIYKLPLNSSISDEYWFSNRERYIRFDAKNIHIDTSEFTDRELNDIENATSNEIYGNDSINKSDNTYNRNLNLQDFIRLHSKKWSVSKYAGIIYQGLDVVGDTYVENYPTSYIRFWGNNTAKTSSNYSDYAEIRYSVNNKRQLTINGNVYMQDGLVVNRAIQSNQNVSIVNGSSHIRLECDSTVGRVITPSINASFTSSATNVNLSKTAYFNTNYAIYINSNSTVQYNSRKTVKYTQGINAEYGNNSYITINNNATVISRNNISLYAYSNLSAQYTNANITYSGTSQVVMNKFCAYSNGTVKATTIDMRNDGSYSYIYMNYASSTTPYIYHPSGSNTIYFQRSNLEVSGTITANKVYNAVYNDYAELYEKDDVEEQIVAGDVIEINPKTGKYRKTSKAYSKYVVGVCSDTYGHLLGGRSGVSIEENLKYNIPVGLCGKVYVKVTGQVNIGDLLVSSAIPGIAMSASNIDCVGVTSITGSIIGKALSNIEDGKVLMQIMLQ